MFHKKIKEIIKNNNVDYTLQAYKTEPIILWHFLHNQKDDHNFLDIKNYCIDIIMKSEDQNIKYKLLDYFEKHCTQNYSYEVLAILSYLLHYNTNEIFNRRVARSIKKLEITKIDWLFMESVITLLQKSDIYTKIFAIESANEFISYYTNDQVSGIINNIFFDISGSINFDNKVNKEIFREAAGFLGKVLQNPKHVKDFLPQAIIIYNNILQQQYKSYPKRGKIAYTHVRSLSNVSGSVVKERDFKYEDDPQERIALEIQYALEKIYETDNGIIPELCDTIIKNGEYLVYFEILNKFLLDKIEVYPNIVEELLFNKDLLQVIDLLDVRWHTLYNRLLSVDKNVVQKLELFIKNYSESDTETPGLIKAELVNLIPAEQRSPLMEKIKIDYEEKVKKEHNTTNYSLQVRDNNEVKWMRGKDIFDASLLIDRKEIDYLKGIIEEYAISDNFEKSIRDLSKPFEDYISRNPDQLKELYQEIKKISHSNDYIDSLFGGMAKGYLSYYEKNDSSNIYQHTFDLYNIFGDRDNKHEAPARQQIAWFLERESDYIRSENTGKLQESNPELFTKLKGLIIKLATDSNPEYEDQEDNVSLNSVRGIGTSLVCIFGFYYPQDTDIIQIIRDLSNDKNLGIQAYLIQNLIYLIPDHKNYSLCEEIINNKKDTDKEILQKAIVKYMFRLGNKKIEDKKDLLQRLCNSPYESVKESIGDLIGQAILHEVKIEDIFNKVLEEKIGNKNVLVHIVLAFQTEMATIMSEQDIEKKSLHLSYFEKLINFRSQNEETNKNIRSRIGYCFSDFEKFPNDSFDTFYQKGILTKLVEIPNKELQRELSEFFLNIIQKDQHIEEIIDLLLLQSERKENDYSVMLSEQRQAQEIIAILKVLYQKKETLSKEIFKKAEQLFDEGLRYGLPGFYDILETYYS